MRRRILALSITIATTVTALACIDLTPNELPPEAPEIGPPDVLVPDGGDADADADPRLPCERCLEGDGGSPCAAQYAACEGDPICKRIFTCAAALGCLELNTTQNVVGCGLPCAQDAGLRSQYDPPGQEILNLLLCGQRTCTGSCAWSTDH